MWMCGSCDAQFGGHQDYMQHLGQYDHWAECETCPKTFRTLQSCHQHMDATDHYATIYHCDTCEEVFWTPAFANAHMQRYGHSQRVNYCQDCDRQFQSESNFRAHMNSKTHRGTTVACPFCGNKFVSASGLSHHLESASCPQAPQLNREEIIRIIRQRDPHGAITNRQLTWHEEPKVTYYATEHAWNGYAWECYLCHRTFNSDRALNQHLNSPVHQEKAYHCPNKQCGHQFVSLAALFNHLESEICGHMRFEQVQRSVEQVICSNRLLTFG